MQINDVYQDEDELRHGLVSPCNTPYWYNDSINQIGEHYLLHDALKNVFDGNTELNLLYKKTLFDKHPWIAARWLELLPVSIEKKQQLA